MSIVVSASVTTVNATVEPTSVVVSLPTQVITINAGVPGPPGRNGIDGGSLLWETVTSGQALVAGHGYKYNGTAVALFTLPEDPSNGDRVALIRINDGNWQVKSDDKALYVVSELVPAVTGYAQSMEAGGRMELAYTGGDRWEASAMIGNIEVGG
jgi:hypothetical protein